MAEQIISPGVFTRENDLSFLPQGIGAIGAAVVGPTVKGPAFVPTVIKSIGEYNTRFGGLSQDTFVPQTIREYLKNAGTVTVVRVLAGGGYTFANNTTEPAALIVGSSAADEVRAAASMSIDSFIDGLIVNITASNGSYKFIAADAPVPLDIPAQNTYFYEKGANLPANMANLVAQIQASDIADTFVSGNGGANGQGLQMTASAGINQVDLGHTLGMNSASAAGVPAANPVTLAGGVNSTIAGGVLLGMLFPSKHTSTPSLHTSTLRSTTNASHGIISASFKIDLDGAVGSAGAFSASVNPNADDYLFSFLGDDPNNSKSGDVIYANPTPAYTYLNFKNVQTNIQGTASLAGYGSGIGSGSQVVLATLNATDAVYSGNGNGLNEKYSWASTPYIQSQIAKGRKDLFKFHTINHGTSCNMDYKISITNLREPANIDNEEQYSTFTVQVRKYGDTDKNPVVYEEYSNCNLDPNSPNYIARKIGDRYPKYNETLAKVELLGNYPNISTRVRVQVASAVEARSTSPKLSPKGFGAVSDTFNTASLTLTCQFPSASYELVQQTGTAGTYNVDGYLGWKFNDKDQDNKNWIKPLQDGAVENSAGNFSVEDGFGHASSSLWAGPEKSLSASLSLTGATGPVASQLKFTVPFQGGDDGIAPWTVKFTGAEATEAGTYSTGDNLYGFDMNTTDAAGYKGYKKALDIISNQDEYDINMLAMPGVVHSIHPLVTNAGIDMCEGRGDTFFVMDLNTKDATVNTAVSNVSGLDTNYAAVYYPWVKVLDTSINKPVFVPPSVIVPGAIAQSDRIGAEWFAPAGLNRGILGNVIETKIRLNQRERDTLYNSKINPIATFPQTGVCIWGQKTLQERSTALDRINVRRLMIALKKFIASSSKFLVFEQNTIQTRDRFLNIVNPYLESVQQRQGLFAFRVQMDEGNNTPDVIDRNQLVGGIYLQPAKTAEFIVLDFNILPTGATFPA